MMKKKWIYGSLMAAVVMLSVAATDRYFEVSRNIDVFAALYKDVNNSYVDDTDPSKLMRTCIDGMLKTLDPFTNYISEAQIETYRIQNSEKLVGIGIHFQIIDSLPVVTDLLKDLPADKAGMQIGDRMISLGGESTKGKTYDEVSQALRGQEGSSLSISLRDPMGKEREVTLARQEFQETNVPYSGMLNNDIGYINLKIFNPNAGKDVRFAFEKLKKEHPDMKGIVLDLRGNGGGLLAEAVNIVNIFVEKNKLVVTTKGRVTEWNNTFKTLNEPTDTKMPVAILTDSKSASASEIVSGCLQDYDRAVVIGQKTYGKGLVQITKNLSYNTMLKVTTAKYYIPSGRCIQAINYAEHNEDGSVKRIPDSLKKEFKTAAGRRVWDGGGVDPDMPMPKETQGPLVQALITKHVIFDYANIYKQKHATIPPAAEFKLSDQDYNDFTSFAKTKDFSYQTESDRLLDKLKEAAKEEKYFDAVKGQYEDIRKKMESDKQSALSKNKKEIITLLENEICGRYYFLTGKIEKSLQNDPMAVKAIEILALPEGRYKELLSTHR